MSTFVSVGNSHQPFSRLLQAIPSLIDVLPKPIVVQHGHTPFRNESVCAVEFLGVEQFVEQIKEAQLLISHAGAGAVVQAIAAGRVPLVMPRRRIFGEIVDDHQVEFARAMEDAGLVVVANDAASLHAGVRNILSRTTGPESTTEEPKLVGLVRNVLAEYARN